MIELARQQAAFKGKFILYLIDFKCSELLISDKGQKKDQIHHEFIGVSLMSIVLFRIEIKRQFKKKT